MQSPPIPSYEDARLQELDAYKIVDTLPEQDYDDLTALAAQICGTPISLVSLVDDRRQWFKSRHGLDAPETPKEYAFCAHAINQPKEIFIVNDARTDERFQDNPLVTGDPNVVFYAGMPLVNEKGLPLGTICVIDHSPKELSEDQIRSLKSLSRQVMNLLELHRKKKELEKVVADLENRNDELEQFAQVAAHDLKSPLNNISMLLDLLKQDFGPALGTDGEELVAMLKRSSGKLKNMIDGLLAYSRSDRHADISPARIPVRELEALLRDLLVAKSEGTLEVESELNEVYTNKAALEQVLINLSSNAIKYNDKPRPKISVHITEDREFYRFTVQDNGPGIPEKMEDKVFQIFQVGASRDRFGHRGNGIGLATVQKVVHAMGGKISLSSEAGEGATFTFTFKKPRMQEVV